MKTKFLSTLQKPNNGVILIDDYKNFNQQYRNSVGIILKQIEYNLFYCLVDNIKAFVRIDKFGPPWDKLNELSNF